MTMTKFKDNPVTLVGKQLAIGDSAPMVTVVTADLAEKQVGGSAEQVQLLLAVPSLDTGVCASEARKFNEKVAALSHVDTTIISMDLPFAAKRFCTAEGIDKLTAASDFRNKAFANAYGVLIGDGPLAGLTCRAVFVVDKAGKISYKEIVSEITQEPDYEKVLAAIG